MKKTTIVYHGDISYYDFGEGHAVRGNRFPRYLRLLKSKGLFEDETLNLVEPEAATDEDLLLVHSAEYITKVKRLADDNGILAEDTPLSPNILKGVMRIVGASLKAGEIVVNGEANSAQGVGGGLHHAGRDFGEGYCVFNDVAVCAKALLERHGLKRVMIFDSDAHTGHGTMQIFYDEPRVLYLSSHQDPKKLYPYTGFVDQIGKGAGEGYTVNVPLPVGADDECMQLVLSRVFQPLLEQFKPEVLIRCGGADPHWRDEIGNLGLTYRGLWSIGKAVREASRAQGCGVIDLLCSGYAPGREEKVLYSIFAGELGFEIPYKDNKPKNKAAIKLRDKTSKVIDALTVKLSDYWDLNQP